MIFISDKAWDAYDAYKEKGYSTRRTLRIMAKDGYSKTDIGGIKFVCSRKFNNRNKPKWGLFGRKTIIKY